MKQVHVHQAKSLPFVGEKGRSEGGRKRGGGKKEMKRKRGEKRGGGGREVEEGARREEGGERGTRGGEGKEGSRSCKRKKNANKVMINKSSVIHAHYTKKTQRIATRIGLVSSLLLSSSFIFFSIICCLLPVFSELFLPLLFFSFSLFSYFLIWFVPK